MKLLVLFLCLNTVVYGQRVIFHEVDLDKALAMAFEQNKGIFVDTYTRYCPPCKQMDIEFKNKKLAKYLNKNFINVKVNMMNSRAKLYQDQYQIVFLPTLMFIDKHGNLKLKLDRIASANELLALAKAMHKKMYPPAVEALTEVNQKPQKSKALAAQTSPPTVKPSEQRIPRRVIKSTTLETKDSKTSQKDIVQEESPTQKIPRRIISSSNSNQVPNTQESPEKATNMLMPDESEGKILYVMGQGGDDLPPPILKQEAYFRMQLMDGSHHETAAKYLATQSDWSTKENIQFIHDFLYDARSEEFNYFIENRKAFEAVLGKERIEQTLNILVNKELERAFPKPDRDRVTLLYSYIGRFNPEEDALVYELNKLFEENKIEQFLELGKSLHEMPTIDDAQLLDRYSSEKFKSGGSKKHLKQSLRLVERAVKLDPDEITYHINLAHHALKLKDKTKATKHLLEAQSLDKEKEFEAPISKLLNQVAQL